MNSRIYRAACARARLMDVSLSASFTRSVSVSGIGDGIFSGWHYDLAMPQSWFGHEHGKSPGLQRLAP